MLRAMKTHPRSETVQEEACRTLFQVASIYDIKVGPSVESRQLVLLLLNE